MLKQTLFKLRYIHFAIAIIWCVLMVCLMQADVWDETNGLLLFEQLPNSLIDNISTIWSGNLGGMYRPLSVSLAYIVSTIVDDYTYKWKLLRAINICFLLTSLFMFLRASQTWFGKNHYRELLFTVIFLFSGSAISIAGWFANILDASVLLCLSTGIFFISRHRYYLASVILGLAFFCKETALLIFPLLLIIWLGKKISFRQLIAIVTSLIVIGCVYWMIRCQIVPIGSEKDIHSFPLNRFWPTTLSWFESLWWQHTWRDGASWIGITVSVLFLIQIKNLCIALVTALMLFLCVFLYWGMLSYEKDILISHLNFIGRLYLIPTALCLFIALGWGRRYVLLLILPLVLIGGIQTFIHHFKFQQTYLVIYKEAGQWPKPPLYINYPEKYLNDPHRNLHIGKYPDAPISVDIRTGHLIRREPLDVSSDLATNFLQNETHNISFNIDSCVQNENTIEIFGWGYINGESSENSEIYIILRSDKKKYIFDTGLQKRPDVTAHFKTLNFDDSGFLAIISKNKLEKGKYKVGIYITKENIKEFQITDNVVEIQ